MLATTPLPADVIDAAHAVAVPRAAPADSFVLHAPLELMARVGLLPHVAAEARDAAIARIAKLADDYTATGPPVAVPKEADFATLDDAVRALAGAIDDADLDSVDAIMSALTARTTPAELRTRLAPLVVDSLAAAGHTPIGLYLLPLVGGGRLPTSLLRGPVRELARHPDWRIGWFDGGDGSRGAAPDRAGAFDALTAALRAVPRLGRPGSDFIYPLMAQAERSGAAPHALGAILGVAPDVALDVAGRVYLRAAAWSMIHDDPDHAPYGWTHCLTMAQAVMHLAPDAISARRAIAVAGTFVVGFRAAHGIEMLGRLDDDADTESDTHWDTDWDTDWGAPARTDLATFAALHDDAHVVKYTLSCFLAAADDPAWSHTYLRAASSLAQWWRAH